MPEDRLRRTREAYGIPQPFVIVMEPGDSIANDTTHIVTLLAISNIPIPDDVAAKKQS